MIEMQNWENLEARAYYGGRTVITYLDISIFESPAQTLVNTVNTVGVMGKGIALAFKELYPEMFQKYRQLCQDKRIDISRLHVYRTKNKIIVNFPTKKHWRNPSHISYIEAGLQKFVDTYQDYGITSVSFPQLGCGNGELDWDKQVQPLMDQYLSSLPIPVYIHLYSKSPNFIPERLDSLFAKQIRLERQRISADQVWQDLMKLVKNDARSSYFIDIFTTVDMDEEHIYFNFDDQKEIIYREDMEDLWNILRLRGTIKQGNFPQQLIEKQIKHLSASNILFRLLSQLKYVRPITLGTRKNGELTREQGLQYVPEARTDVFVDNEIII